MRLRYRVLLLVVVVLMLVPVTPAEALLNYGGDGMDIWVYGNEGPQDADHRWYGNSASNYVMDNPVLQYMHVNSIYAYYDSNDYIETGWVWRVGYGNDPEKFVAYEREGYTSGQYQHFFGHVTPGSNVYFELNNRTMDGGTWESWRANCAGTTYDRDLNFYKAWCEASSERDDYVSTNYGHWWNLKKKDYQGNWTSWTDGIVHDGDPGYDGSFQNNYYDFYVNY